MKKVTMFKSANGEVYENEEDAKFADLVFEFDENLKDGYYPEVYNRELVAKEIQDRIFFSERNTPFTHFLKWVRFERHAFTAFLEALEDAE